MSKTWNEEELKIASEQMKKMGHMTYEEFCETLKENKQKFSDEQIKEALTEFKQMQLDGDLHFCPRCGEERMRDVPTHNCLSRQADVYVCEVCGAEEAIYAMKGTPLPLDYWHYTGLMEMSQAPTDHKQAE